jgi:chromosome segregation ATPase
MTKFSKVLTVLLVVFSVSFMALSAVSLMSSTDWKSRKKDLSEKTAEQTRELAALETEYAGWDKRLQDAKNTITQDVAALKKKEEVLAAALAKQEEAASALAGQTVVKAKEAQAKRDEARLRREETVALRNQLDELRTQKRDAEAEERRLSDLLVQAQGTLERVERRQELLAADGADSAKAASPPANGAQPANGKAKSAKPYEPQPAAKPQGEAPPQK